MLVIRTEEFIRWLDRLRDETGKFRIQKRIDRAEETGYFGITRAVGEGVHEMKMNFGPGYCVYYAIRGERTLYLLAGSNKDTQAKDIRLAIELLKGIGEEQWELN